MPDIYVHQKHGYVLSSPKILSQVQYIYNNLATNKISSHKKYFPHDKSPIRKQNGIG
jgi:hypothetical protein